MNDLSRRNAAQLMAGVAAGSVVGLSTPTSAQDTAGQPLNVDAKKQVEWQRTLRQMGGYWVREHVRDTLDDVDRRRNMYITSAVLEGKPMQHLVRPQSVVLFHPDANVDAFTKSGGVNYRMMRGKAPMKDGSMKFAEPPHLVMVVRDADGHVDWYSLAVDLRC